MNKGITIKSFAVGKELLKKVGCKVLIAKSGNAAFDLVFF